MATDQTLPLDVTVGPRGLRDAVSDAWQDASLLFRQHAALAATEASERTAGLGIDLAGLLGGVVLVHAAVLGIAAAGGFALHQAGLSAWLASLIVALALGAGGVSMALWARRRMIVRASGPSATLAALGETHEWVSTLLRGGQS